MSELILEGNYTNEEIDAFMLKLLECCKKEQDSIELSKNILILEWREKLKYGMKGQLSLPKDDTLVILKISKVKVWITQCQKKDKNYQLGKMP
eukprot:14172755-Ditylum_brightwellii.AAC.1